MPDHPESRFLFPALDEYPGLPSDKPLFDGILVDDRGGVWVRSFAPDSFGLFDSRLPSHRPSSRTWVVFDASGAWLGELKMPQDFDLKVVARGRLYGVVKDSLDVETVQVFKIAYSSRETS